MSNSLTFSWPSLTEKLNFHDLWWWGKNRPPLCWADKKQPQYFKPINLWALSTKLKVFTSWTVHICDHTRLGLHIRISTQALMQHTSSKIFVRKWDFLEMGNVIIWKLRLLSGIIVSFCVQRVTEDLEGQHLEGRPVSSEVKSSI